MIDGKNIFNQPVKNSMKTNDNIWKIASGQGDDYITSWTIIISKNIKR